MLEDPTVSNDAGNAPNTALPPTEKGDGTPGSLTHDDGTAANRPIAEPRPVTQAPGKSPSNAETATGGLGSGQIFMMVLTVVGIVLVAQGLRRKQVKSKPNEFSEIDAIRRELAAKYPIEPRVKPAPATSSVTHQTSAAMQELADRLAGELDAKAARLESLLAEADHKIAELKEAGAHTPTAPVARLGVHEGPRLNRLASNTDPLHQKVYDLADAGMTPVEIAKSIQQPTGHVELILNLRAAAQGSVRKIGV